MLPSASRRPSAPRDSGLAASSSHSRHLADRLTWYPRIWVVRVNGVEAARSDQLCAIVTEAAQNIEEGSCCLRHRGKPRLSYRRFGVRCQLFGGWCHCWIPSRVAFSHADDGISRELAS